MSYYGRGDYYSGMRGDYYRGDPFIGGLVGAVATAGRTLLPKLAPIVGLGKKAAPALGAIPTIAKSPIVRTAGKVAGTAATAVTLGMAGREIFGGEDAPRKRRRMNVTNVRALRRALRRAEGFEKIAQRTVSALHRGPRKFKKQSRAS